MILLYSSINYWINIIYSDLSIIFVPSINYDPFPPPNSSNSMYSYLQSSTLYIYTLSPFQTRRPARNSLTANSQHLHPSQLLPHLSLLTRLLLRFYLTTLYHLSTSSFSAMGHSFSTLLTFLCTPISAFKLHASTSLYINYHILTLLLNLLTTLLPNSMLLFLLTKITYNYSSKASHCTLSHFIPVHCDYELHR